MKIKALDSFAHMSGKTFQAGREYEVSEASALEFSKAGIAEVIESEVEKNAEKKAKEEK